MIVSVYDKGDDKTMTMGWTGHFVFPWHHIFLCSANGTSRRVWLGDVMRRKLPTGGYEYRDLTEQERVDRFDESAR